MFVYKNHRFHIAGFSFEIPEGYILDQIQSEEYQNSMKMVSPDGSIVISVRPYYKNMVGYVVRDAESMMREFLDDCNECIEVIEPMKMVTRRELQGFCTVYKLDDIMYYEEKYNAPENEYDIGVLEIVVEARKRRTLEEVMADTAISVFLRELF